MKLNHYAKAAVAAMALSATTAAFAGNNVGMLIGFESTTNDNAQESAAAKWFETAYPGGVVITPSTLDKLNADDLAAVWVNIDRCNLGKGTLPAEFSNADVVDALAAFVEDGGNLFLTKQACQLVSTVGRIPAEYNCNIYGDGDGGEGFDDWCVNAYLGSWQINPNNDAKDPSQIYDRRSHAIYAGLTEVAKAVADAEHPGYPLIGTGNPETSLWREDHNCMWDLNGVPAMNAAGKNTLEQFEAQFGCTVIGTWGHVQDYCVAGIVEFAPKGALKGTIVANGLAAYEWNPRTGVNAYHSNITKLTENALNYLAPNASQGVKAVETVAEGAAVYFNALGVQVANPTSGLYIKVVGGKATKVLVK